MRHRTPTRPRVQVDTSKTKRRRNQRRRGFLIRPESLAIEEQLRVELARSPTVQDSSHRIFTDTEQLRDGCKIRTQRRDRTDVEIAIDPTVEPFADAGRERVVDRRVTERTSDSD